MVSACGRYVHLAEIRTPILTRRAFRHFCSQVIDSSVQEPAVKKCVCTCVCVCVCVCVCMCVRVCVCVCLLCTYMHIQMHTCMYIMHIVHLPYVGILYCGCIT